jgi:hypothetical protein
VSSRHRNRRIDATVRPDARTRATQHRHERRSAKLSLALDDPDAVVAPVMASTPEKLPPDERNERGGRSRRFKVWKSPMWKRRKADRKARYGPQPDFA